MPNISSPWLYLTSPFCVPVPLTPSTKNLSAASVSPLLAPLSETISNKATPVFVTSKVPCGVCVFIPILDASKLKVLSIFF